MSKDIAIAIPGIIHVFIGLVGVVNGDTKLAKEFGRHLSSVAEKIVKDFASERGVDLHLHPSNIEIISDDMNNVSFALCGSILNKENCDELSAFETDLQSRIYGIDIASAFQSFLKSKESQPFGFKSRPVFLEVSHECEGTVRRAVFTRINGDTEEMVAVGTFRGRPYFVSGQGDEYGVYGNGSFEDDAACKSDGARIEAAIEVVDFGNDSDGGRLAFLAEQAKLAFLNFGIRKQLAP